MAHNLLIKGFNNTYLVKKQEIEKQTKIMLEQGIIRHCHSSFASPMSLMKKKDDTMQMSIDYRQLNRMIIKDNYPIPIIEDLLDELREATYYTMLDL